MTNNSLNNECKNDFQVTGDSTVSTFTIENTSKNASANSELIISVAGTSAGDPYIQFLGNVSTQKFAVGIDNSDSDILKITQDSSNPTPSSSTQLCLMHADGNVRSPLNASFRAYLSSDQTNVTGAGTDYTVVFDTENFDVGSNYNTGTGVFTAPEDGIYFFYSFVRILGGGAFPSTGGEVKLVVNTTPVCSNTQGFENILDANDEVTAYVSIIQSMSASQTMSVKVQLTGGGVDNNSIQGGSNETIFGGIKLA